MGNMNFDSVSLAIFHCFLPFLLTMKKWNVQQNKNNHFANLYKLTPLNTRFTDLCYFNKSND